MLLMFQFAWRFFKGNQRKGLVSLISGISIAGMSLAIALLIAVLSVMNGFEKEFSERILGVVPHARIHFNTPRDDWPELKQRLQKNADILYAAPFTAFEAMALSGGTATPIGVQGVDSISDLAHLHDYIVWDDLKQATEIEVSLDAQEIIIGAELAKRMNLQAGDSLRLLRVKSLRTQNKNHSNSQVQRISSALSGGQNRTRIYRVRIAGLLSTGTQLDSKIGIVNLAYANEIKGLGQSVEGLQLKVNDVFNVSEIAYNAAITAGVYGHLTHWKTDYGNLYAAIQLSRQLVVMLVATIVAVAVFNIFVTLGMVVRHKRNEIAVLKTLGLTRKRVIALFFLLGVIIAIPGCVLGAIAGIAISIILPDVVVVFQNMLGIELLNTDIYPINYLPTELRFRDVLTIIGLALGMSFIATLAPAFQASRMQPAGVLKYRS